MPAWVVLPVCVWLAMAASPASAQNDWQFPDPYFGAIEIEKSHRPSGDMRRPRPEIAPPAWRERATAARPRPRVFRPRPMRSARVVGP